jgi:hypothetical protein
MLQNRTFRVVLSSGESPVTLEDLPFEGIEIMYDGTELVQQFR